MNPASNPLLSGFVLAGGKSRRMGRDKATLDFEQHSLLEHMVQLLSTVASPVRVIGREDFPDPVPDCGPLGGIWTALLISSTAMNLVVAVDLPLLTTEFLAWFCDRLKGASKTLVACRTGEQFPLCLGIHRDLESHVGSRIQSGDFALHRWIASLDGEIISEGELQAAGFSRSIFQNFNTPEDWQRLKQ